MPECLKLPLGFVIKFSQKFDMKILMSHRLNKAKKLHKRTIK